MPKCIELLLNNFLRALTGAMIMCAALPAAHGAQLVYHVDLQSEESLRICVERSQNGNTQLFLPGRTALFPPQVEDLTCDGEALLANGEGRWWVPAACRSVCWRVPLRDARDTPVSAGQSIRRGAFVALSGDSSLPHFADADRDGARVVLQGGVVRTVVPTPHADGSFSLPPPNEAPLLILLNAVPVNTLSAGEVYLTYLVDDIESATGLPRQEAHLRGLSWLQQHLAPHQQATFTMAWVGLATKQMSAAGMASRSFLMANYPADGEWPLGGAMLLYVALHEAVHQLATGDVAPWLAESIPSYYGVRATEAALPGDPTVAALMDKSAHRPPAFPRVSWLSITKLSMAEWSSTELFTRKESCFGKLLTTRYKWMVGGVWMMCCRGFSPVKPQGMDVQRLEHISLCPKKCGRTCNGSFSDPMPSIEGASSPSI